YNDDNLFSEEYHQFDDENDLYKFTENPEVLIGREVNGKITSRNINAVLNDVDVICMYSECESKCIKLCGIKINDHESEDILWYKIGEISSTKKNISFQVTVRISYLELNGEKLPRNSLFRVVIDSNEYNEKVLDVIKRYRDKISSVLIDSLLFENGKKIKKLIEYLKSNQIKSDVDDKDQNDWKEIEIDKLMSETFSQTMNKEFQTLSTGIVCSCTGEYVSVPLSGFVKHVIIDFEDINEDVLNFLDEVCSINSSIWIKGEKPSTKSKLYNIKGLNAKYLKKEWIEDIKEKTAENYSFPKNLVSVENNIIDINGIIDNAGLKMIEVPYSKLRDSKSPGLNYNKVNNKDMTIVSVDTEEDFSAFLNEVDEYYKTKKIYHSSLLNSRMKNVCRFLSRNYCSLTKIPRIEIDNTGNVYPCYERLAPIGSIKDSMFDITQSAYLKHEIKIKENLCSKCEVAVGCSKCACMPDFIKEKYCYLMINKPYITDFILESMIISHMRYINKEVSKLKTKDIRISNEHMQNLLTQYENGSENPFFSKYVFLAVTDSFYSIWSPSTNKIYRVTREISIIAEALLKRINPTEIIKIVAKEINLSEEEALVLCNDVFRLFYKNNFLYRPVQI
ncbi:TPA: hypothetical protein JRS23_004416, partial [Escherichia coli]|nr:hypothetical protein [Escherichia coli]